MQNNDRGVLERRTRKRERPLARDGTAGLLLLLPRFTSINILRKRKKNDTKKKRGLGNLNGGVNRRGPTGKGGKAHLDAGLQNEDVRISDPSIRRCLVQLQRKAWARSAWSRKGVG